MISVGVQLATGGATIHDIVRAACRYERANVESVWIGDHLIDYYEPRFPVPECFVTCTCVLEATETLRVGTLAVNSLTRHPGLIAKMAATLHERFPGRFELGLGAGGTKNEFKSLGVVFPDRGARVERLRHTLQVLRRLGDPGPVSDSETGLKDAHCRPSIHGIPIVVASLAPRTARLAGELADEINVIDYAQGVDVPALLAVAREAASGVGKELKSSLLVPNAKESRIGGGPHPRAGMERAEKLGVERVIFRLLPPDFRDPFGSHGQFLSGDHA